ncbi:MAG: hypothetical protein ACR2H4_03555 [Pyrinomonadaceae bacterium]
MGDQIGSIASGLHADIIELEGNPLNDISAVRRVVFVMKGGQEHSAQNDFCSDRRKDQDLIE